MTWDDDDGLREFLARATDHRLLTHREEIAYGRAARAGDIRARNALVEYNVRLVVSIAQRYRFRGCPHADLIQDGLVGLHTAANKFDPEMGFRFSTYATWWVRKAIQRGIVRQDAKGAISLQDGTNGEEPYTTMSEHVQDNDAVDPYDAAVDDLPDLEEALGSLPQLQRQILEMRFGLYDEPQTIGQIALAIGKPDHIVQSAQRRALTALREGTLNGIR